MILDTNALSAFADGNADIRSYFETASAIYIPSIVLGEYVFGVLQSNRREAYEAWLSRVVTKQNVIRPGAVTARLYAKLRLELKQKGQPTPYHDIWIAALALELNQPVLSRDSHFDRMTGIQRLSW
jgi:predicted nucleic acid-binding protein